MQRMRLQWRLEIVYKYQCEDLIQTCLLVSLDKVLKNSLNDLGRNLMNSNCLH